LATTALKHAAITRAAFDYQDLIGIGVLIAFFRDPKRYHWVELESEDRSAGFLDDVVALRTDGKFEYTQVKFTVDPDRYLLDWDWLLERKARGTSRLKKWADSVSNFNKSGGLGRAELRTNRSPDSEFGRALQGDLIKLGKLSPSRRAAIEQELGGAKAARAFFNAFQFRHSEVPDVQGLEQRLKGTIVPTDTTTDGWLLLRQQVRRWATERKQPEPDGKIRHGHLVQIISKKRPRPIPQNFLVPDIYAVPSIDFHDRFLKRVTTGRSALSIVWGTPGRGKSTYLSFLINQLSKKKLPCIRHHYFLSLDDATTDRISFSDVAISMMDQIAARYPEATKQRGLEVSPNAFREWIAVCGEYFAKENKRFYVVVDGLDHVWRERMNIDQMDHLFSYLLPCPKNVVLIVGTQRVADLQLPSKLLAQASASAWIEIPPMDERAVHNWITGQDKAKRLRLPGYAHRTVQRKQTIDEISRAFSKISRGHPLHLIYSFETLVRRGTIVTLDEVSVLPPCPEGDIRKYYRRLWQRLKPQGKQVLHLVAGSEFHWPADGLRRCVGSLDDIDHLLEHRRTGVMPFHGSIVAFAREQVDHESTYRALLPNVIRWLERDAPPFWRWGWLWIAKAKNGKEADLLKKTTRQWAIESLAHGWPDNQIVAILRETENAAFAVGDYSRCIEARSIKIRMQNGPQFQMHRYSEFVEAAIRSSENHQQVLNMADEIGSLSDAQIVALLRSLPEDLSEEIGRECEAELRRRVNLWLILRNRPSDEFRTLMRHAFEALARISDLKVKNLLTFVEGFAESDQVFQSLLDCLTRGLRLNELAELFGLLKAEKYRVWRSWCEDALVRAFSVAGADLKACIDNTRLTKVSPLLGCYLSFQGEPPPFLHFDYDPTFLERERHEYGPNPGLEKFFHGLFFSAFAMYRIAAGTFSFFLPGVEETKLGWMKGAMDTLRDLARDISNGSVEPNFGIVFERTHDLSPVTGRRTTEADSTQYWSFKFALRQIAIDLHLITSAPGQLIPASHFAAARASRHWQDEAWLNDNLENRFVLVEKQGAQSLLDALYQKETRSITTFNERAERWTELALFALLYGLPNSTSYVKRAADCLTGYGYHKDVYIYDVLGSIDLLRRAGSPKALGLLKKIAPVVDQIMEMTDGDEVRGSRSELIELIAELCPDKLPDCYAHHIQQDRFSLAEDALEAYCKRVDLDNEVERALARTFMERRDVLILSDLKAAGASGAGLALAEQERLLGGVAVSREHEHGKSSNDFARKGKPPDIRKFKPSQFAKLVDRVSNPNLAYEHREKVLGRWIEYWKQQKKGREALKAVERFFRDTEGTYWAERILDDAFLVSLEIQGKRDAYKWLVRAHSVRHGWHGYWRSSEEAIRRLEWAAKHYKDRWEDFVRDTSKAEIFWEKHDYGLSIGLSYLVRFLILVDQKEVAAQYAATLVAILIEEVADQPLPEIPWLR
jgi:hypothetical protein